MSAARYTVASIPSSSRMGVFGTVLYAWMWNRVSTPASLPELRVRFGCTHAPLAGVHTSSFGSVVFSFGAPVHQRGPFWAELGGSLFASARPHDAVRHVPGAVMP